MPDPDSRPQYPIRTAARRTGLSPHVLRAWERRYGVPEPARPEGGRRLYSNADILHLRLLGRLTRAGHGIGQISALPVPELLSLLQQEEDLEEAADHSPREGDRYLGEALAALEGMDARQLHATLTRSVVSLSAREFVDGVVVPLLRHTGRLWAEGEICPAHEHLLSVQVARVLGWLADTIPVPSGAPDAVATTPAGQRHEFGALLASVVAAEEGWRVTYLGPDLPARDIGIAVEARQARVLLLSAILEEEPSRLLSELREIHAATGGGTHVLVGGRGVAALRDGIERMGGRWLPDLDALRASLRDLSSTIVGT